MKKILIFCLFFILSLGLFAQQLNTDGEPHFDKLVGVKFVKPYSPDGGDYIMSQLQKKEMTII